ncbi:MAG: hypothetical protein AAGA46_03430 [Cyanobacteria bacterium P01_F01_bin.13]
MPATSTPTTQAFRPALRTGKTQHTQAAAQILQRLTGFDPTKLGQSMTLEDVQRLSLTAEQMQEQVKFAKHAAKKLNDILKNAQTLEQLRADVMKAGLDKYQAINEILAQLTTETHQAGIDEKLLQQKIQGQLQWQSAKAGADAAIQKQSLSARLLKLKQGTGTRMQVMRQTTQREIKEERTRIIGAEKTASARRQYNQVMTQAMNGEIPAGRARGILGGLKKALTASW